MSDEFHVVWACKFKMGKRKVKSIMPPTKGVLSKERWSVCTDKNVVNLVWFLPFSKDNKIEYLAPELVADIVVCETEAECIEEYNKLVLSGVKQLVEYVKDFSNLYQTTDSDDDTIKNICQALDDIRQLVD